MKGLLLVLVPLLPAAVSVTLLLFSAVGKRGWKPSGFMVVAGTLLSGLTLMLVGPAGGVAGIEWFQTGAFTVEAVLRIDGLSWTVALTVVVVSSLVNLYAVGYIRSAADRNRFFGWMSLFTAAMLLLVLSESLLLLFVAWEFVGVASWALIGFHHREQQARAAARKALLMTRTADMGLLLGILLAAAQTGSTGVQGLLAAVGSGMLSPSVLTTLCLLFLLAAAGKSAQLPLTAWLPDAMVGPTPVSALIHSATMVAAGVYLILRLFPLYEAAPGGLPMLLWLGAATALVAALSATRSFDLKRILAWSTISQLGEMMFALGVAGPVAAVFHLVSHALFKSTLFLTAGVIDQTTGSRDLRSLCGLGRLLPGTALAFLLGGLALAGMPPFSGFWSEEEILLRAGQYGFPAGVFLLLMVFLAGVYISRAGAALFLGRPGTAEPEVSRPSRMMTVPMLGLAGLAAFGGILKWFLEDLVPFNVSGETDLAWAWRASAIGASLTGLATGLVMVRNFGPRPVFGEWPLVFWRLLNWVALKPAGLITGLGGRLPAAERGLDGAVRALCRGVFSLSGPAEREQFGGLTVSAGERALDGAGRLLCGSTLTLAKVAERTEDEGFAEGLDRVAGQIQAAGDSLGRLQTGKVYLYVVGIFLWTLLAGVGLLLLWP